MNKIITTVFLLAAWTGLFAQRTTLPNTANQTPSNKNLKNLNGQVIEGRIVVNDSCWLNGAQILVPNGNVGIGTITPEAKLHVAISDTTGIEIAHFENNMDNAIITVHSHGDSSAFYLLQTGGYTGGVALIGTTKELAIINGLGAIAIAIDTLGNVTIPDLAGSAQKLITADATGTLDTAFNISAFTIDNDGNMYAGTDALAALTSGALNFVAGINAGAIIEDGNANTIIGNDATVETSSTNGAISLGYGANASESSISFGFNSQTHAASSIAFGQTTVVALGHTYSIALGINATTTASKQLFVTDSILHTSFKGELVCRDKAINTTAGDAATIDAIAGRFRKDNSGATFTLTDSYITANSIIQITPANAAIDATATTWTISAGVGSATITFNAAPTSNFDMNFWIIN